MTISPKFTPTSSNPENISSLGPDMIDLMASIVDDIDEIGIPTDSPSATSHLSNEEAAELLGYGIAA